jgi:hypothetical protein
MARRQKVKLEQPPEELLEVFQVAWAALPGDQDLLLEGVAARPRPPHRQIRLTTKG